MGKADLLRKLIREEVKKALREEMPSILKEIVGNAGKTVIKETSKKEYDLPLTLNKTPQKVIAPKFAPNNPLAALLNETATSMTQGGEDNWPTIGMDSSDVSAAEFMARDSAPVGDVSDMLAMSKRSGAVEMVQVNAVPDFNGDPNKIYISGHSSGGHLAGVTLVTNWKKDYDLPMNIIKGGLLCSGMYDLKPARLSARSSYVKFTDSMEDALSTQRHLEFLNTPIIVAHGSLETPDFQRQSRDFAKAVKDMGKPVDYIVGQNYNHFEMPETIANPYGILGKLVLKQMKLV